MNKYFDVSRLVLIPIFLMSFVAHFVCAEDASNPDAYGFSVSRLSLLHSAMQKEVDNQKLAGTVTLLARHGHIVSVQAYGFQDLSHATPMKEDSIFRIFSMTKPITAVAMLMLYEEGKWLPQDPIEKYIPEFKNVMVCVGKNKDGSLQLEKPKHAPTMHELMTHTAGFALGVLNTPVNLDYKTADLFNSSDLNQFIKTLSQLPLDYQPGTQWEYSVSSDIQGYLIERLSGMSLEQFLATRIFLPLEMSDTGFDVPASKRSRLATTYQPDGEGVLQPMWTDEKDTRAPRMLSGGGGLFSTAKDYWHFAQMLLDGGTFKGKRLLAPSSVALLRSNQLSNEMRDGRFGIGPYVMREGLGFGYGVGVFDDPLRVQKTLGKNSYFWIGAAGTWFWIDPANDLLFIGLSQRWMLAPGMPNVEDQSQALVYQALVESH